MSIQPISRRVYLVYVWNGKVFFLNWEFQWLFIFLDLLPKFPYRHAHLEDYAYKTTRSYDESYD